MSPTRAKRPAVVLEEAADHIERVGLHKGDYFDELYVKGDPDAGAPSRGQQPVQNAPCCSLGAMALASGKYTPDSRHSYGYTLKEPGFGPEWQASADAEAAMEEWLAATVEDDSLNGAYTTVDAWNDDPYRTGEQVVAGLRAAAAMARTEHPGFYAEMAQ